MAGWSGRHCLGGVYPTLVVNDDDWQDQAGDDAELELAVQVAALSQKITASQAQCTKYFITVSRRNCLRRLHLSGCFVKPDRCVEVTCLDQVNTDDFDSVCQACKKKILAECGRDNGDQSSSELDEGNEPI